MTLPISTRQSVQKLRDRNFDEPQANAIVEVIEDATRELVTKEHFETRLRAELRALEARMEARFVALEERQRSETQALRAELYRALAVQGGLIVGAGVSLVKLL